MSEGVTDVEHQLSNVEQEDTENMIQDWITSLACDNDSVRTCTEENSVGVVLMPLEVSDG